MYLKGEVGVIGKCERSTMCYADPLQAIIFQKQKWWAWKDYNIWLFSERY